MFKICKTLFRTLVLFYTVNLLLLNPIYKYEIKKFLVVILIYVYFDNITYFSKCFSPHVYINIYICILWLKGKETFLMFYLYFL